MQVRMVYDLKFSQYYCRQHHVRPDNLGTLCGEDYPD